MSPLVLLGPGRKLGGQKRVIASTQLRCAHTHICTPWQCSSLNVRTLARIVQKKELNFSLPGDYLGKQNSKVQNGACSARD